ncbi:hypothetical protein DLM75_19500 [Leptospira stimsonii]|uniref:Uncharacterized protein n=1 Tax=Leptospira stimsonii TaxID=2202203 RepID=A0A396YWJ9_9LEPT|nr:hypothetical protein DLM75_19500 [Leptospira stimsonii]
MKFKPEEFLKFRRGKLKKRIRFQWRKMIPLLENKRNLNPSEILKKNTKRKIGNLCLRRGNVSKNV